MPSRIAAQQFPPFPDPVVDNSFNSGGSKDWWRKPSGREAGPRDLRPEIRKAASVTSEPIARQQSRLRQPSGTPSSRQKVSQSYRPNSPAWWKRLKNQASVRNFRDCIVSYTTSETVHDKDANLSTLLIRATEGSCRKQADALMHTLAERAGQTAIEPVMRELVQSVFVPAARSALADHAPPPEASTASVKGSQPSEASLDR